MKLHPQRGGTFLGLIIGLVLGLAMALAVAVYVTKVPTPFSHKNQPRSNDQDTQESEKNKNWNPNSALQPKLPAEPPLAPIAPQSDKTPAMDPTGAAIATPVPATPPSGELLPAVTADPLGDLVKSKTGLTSSANSDAGSDPFDYLVQAGAYRSQDDANAQKAKLSLMGLSAKVTEHDQAGRMVYRVRLGPYDNKAKAERIRTQLEGSGIDNTLVRVQR